MSKYVNAGQVSTSSRAFLLKLYMGFVASLERKYEFLKNISFNLQAAVRYT